MELSPAEMKREDRKRIRGEGEVREWAFSFFSELVSGEMAMRQRYDHDEELLVGKKKE